MIVCILLVVDYLSGKLNWLLKDDYHNVCISAKTDGT